MRKIIVVLVIVALLGAGGWWLYRQKVAQEAEPEAAWEETTVQRGTLTALVNATGSILPEKQTTLAFQSPGRVAEVLVAEGDAVRAGQVLARLDTTDLDLAVAQAELALRQAEAAKAQAQAALEQARIGLSTAQAQLLRTQQGASAYDIAAANAAVESAKAAYRRLLAGPTEEEKRVARANLDQAEAALEQAQAAYDQVADRPDVAMLPQALQLQQATSAYEVAKANYELTLREPSEAEIASARSAIAQAEASLQRLLEGVSEEDLLVAQLAVEQARVGVDQAQAGVDQAQVGVEQAQLSLDQARSRLADAELTAPHDGVITMVGVKEGELTGGQPAFVLTDLSAYHVEVTVDEIDIGRVVEGQPVTVTLDALPGEALSGWVDAIAETASLDAGVVSYKVTIRLKPTTAPLRAGMTATVDIVTERRENVLLVPNRFVRLDRASGRAFVDKLVEGEPVSVEIQIGLRDETYSEVLTGLQEGDVIVLVTESSREQLRRAVGGPPH